MKRLTGALVPKKEKIIFQIAPAADFQHVSLGMRGRLLRRIRLPLQVPAAGSGRGRTAAWENAETRERALVHAHWFKRSAHARKKLKDWRRHCNEDRPLSASG